MGLNMNYSLLMESSNSVEHIPVYGKYYNPSVFSEEYITEAIAAFNQEIRDVDNYLESLYNNQSLNEAFSVTDIVSGIKSAISRARKALSNLYHIIIEFIIKLGKDLTAKIDELMMKTNANLSYYEKISILKRSLNNMDSSEKKIQISSIDFTTDLLDDNFPNMQAIYDPMFVRNVNDLFKTTVHASNDFWTHGEPMQLSNASDSANDIRNNIMKDRERLLTMTFRNHPYDDTNIIGSAIDVAKKAFGSNDASEVELSVDLYMKASDNLAKAKKIGNDLEDKKKEYDRVYKDLDKGLNEIDVRIDSMFKMANPTSVNLKSAYFDLTRQICGVLREALNTIRTISDANHKLFTNKMLRVKSIKDSSAKIILTCEKIIAKNKKLDNDGKDSVKESFDSEVFYGRETVNEFSQIQEDFNTAAVVIAEMYNENSFSGDIIRAINEAEGDQQQQSASNNNPAPNTAPAANNPQQNTATRPPQNQTQNQNSGLKQKLGDTLAYIENLLKKLGETFKRFKARVEELVLNNLENKSFWEKNRARIQKTPITDTKLNDWYNYKIDYFKNSTILPFDVTSKDLESDQAFQDAIIKKITGGANIDPKMFGEKDTFSQKINKIYQGEYKNNENGDGMPANTIGYDHKAAFDFVDSFILKGFNSDALASVGSDYKSIDTMFKNIKNNPGQFQQKMNTVNAQNTQANADNTKSEPQNASAIEDDDFRFNLAEHFGLTQYHEASFGAGTVDSQNILTDDSGKSEKNTEFDTRLKRWFNYSTVAITAKMTAAVSCYKQYMSLFRFVYGGKKKPVENTENNNQQQNAQANQESADILNEREFGRHFEHIEDRQEREIRNDNKPSSNTSTNHQTSTTNKEVKDDNGNDIGEKGKLRPNHTFTMLGVEYKTGPDGKITHVDGEALGESVDMKKKIIKETCLAILSALDEIAVRKVNPVSPLGYMYPKSGKALNGVPIEIYTSDKDLENKELFESSVKELNNDLPKIKSNLSKLFDAFVEWFNKPVHSDDGIEYDNNTITKNTIPKPYCQVYDAKHHTFEMNFEIPNGKYNDPYAAEMNLQTGKFSFWPI